MINQKRKQIANTVPDAQEILRGFNILLGCRHVYELRALGADRCGTISGYFDADHRLEMAEAANDWSGKAEGVYLTINPVLPDLIARAFNRCRVWAKYTTSDDQIMRRHWVPIDFDAKRPAGISSTDEEHEAALDRTRDCYRWLLSQGFPKNSLVIADSGNGGHLLVRVSLNNTEECKELVRRCIEAVAFHFTDKVVDVDLKMFNAARIFKVYGSMACKGDSISERPHRFARLLKVPKKIEAAPLSVLKDLAALVPEEPKSKVQQYQVFRGRSFDVASWIVEHKLSVVEEKPWKGGHAWVLNPCPWNPDHTNRAAYILQFPSGAIAAGCHHNGCTGNDWHALRDLYEPGWRERRRDDGLAIPEGVSPAMETEYRRVKKSRSRNSSR